MLPCSRVLQVAAVIGVAACTFAACGGAIEPTPEKTQTREAGGYAGPAQDAPVASATPSLPPPAPSGMPSEPGPSPGAPTFVKGPLGFVVRDAFSFDLFGPTADRQVRGVWLTAFASACDKTKATDGAGVLRIDFTAEAGEVPPGTYPLAVPQVGEKSTVAEVWSVSGAGCSGMASSGARLESGTVTITSSDAMGMAGSFEGTLVGPSGNQGYVAGHFVAPRCPGGRGACNP
jgi:hypothetical protein